MSDALVPLCRCKDTIQAQAIRASLEARGVFAVIEGEHHGNMLGMFANVIAPRILVPRSQLRLAYELACEVIEDLPEPEFDDDPELAHEREPPPLRRAMPEDLVPYPDDDEYEYDDDDEDGALVEADEDEEDDLAEMRERRSLLGPRIGVGLGVSFGLLQLAAQQIASGVIVLAAMALLVHLRIIPITKPSA